MNTRPELPSNIEAEQALLGAILVNNDAIARAQSVGLKPSDFSEKIHAAIYDACEKVIDSGKTANNVTVKNLLPDQGMIGNLTISQYLARLAAEAVNILNAKDYALAIIDIWKRREMRICGEALAKASDIPDEAERDEEQTAIETRMQIARSRGNDDAEDSIGAGEAYIQAFQKSGNDPSTVGVPIVFKELEQVLSEPEFEQGNLYGLLSSSGEGKTSLTIQIMLHALKHGHPVLLLSYDQTREQIVRQWIAQEYGIEARRQRKPFELLNQQEQEQCFGFARWVDQQPLQIIKCRRQGVIELCRYTSAFRRRHRSNPKTALVVVDHIGKIMPRDPRLSPDRISGEITVEFKATAEKERAAFLVLNQRNTAGVKRDNPRPVDFDLYGGEGAKADYDAVAYLYRAEKYRNAREKIASSDADWKRINQTFPPMEQIRGMAELGAIKVRFGDPNITKDIRFEAKFTRYVSLRRDDEQQRMAV